MAWVKAEYSNQLDYNGLGKIKQTFMRPEKWYFQMVESGSMSKYIAISLSTLNPI